MISLSKSRIKTRWMLVTFALTVAICIVAAWNNPEGFLLAYLASALLPWSVSAGALVWQLIACLTGGEWSRVAWPWFARCSRMMPLIGLLFLPLMLGVSWLYPWHEGTFFDPYEHTRHRRWYFQSGFFISRTVAYFLIWSVLAWLISERDAGRVRGGQPIAGLGLVAMLITITWAMMDWVMSLDPFFTSSIFGVWMGGGALLSAMAVAVVGVGTQRGKSDTSVSENAFTGLTNLLLASLLLWAYFSLSQFLIMWNGDLPFEANFYLERTRGVWFPIMLLLIFMGFVIPFFTLLSSRVRRNRRVGYLAAGLLVVRGLELTWIVMPGGSAVGGSAVGDSGEWSKLLLVLPATAAVLLPVAGLACWLSIPAASDDDGSSWKTAEASR